MTGAPPLRAWTSDHHVLPLPDGHPFPAQKYRAVRECLLADGTLEPAALSWSEPAPVEWLHAAHAHDYVAGVLAGTLTPHARRRLGLPWSDALVRRARAAVFGTVCAAEAALAHGIAANLAGGTHHAFHDHGEGYCLFNDAAVAIARLRAHGRAARPMIVDLDVHHGNGTAAMFAHDSRVFTFSIHARTNYPLHKPPGSFDLALEDDTGDDEYLRVLGQSLPAALDRHAPDLVFYQAGVDALVHDRLGRLALTHAGLAARDARVFAWLAERALPVVVLMGGGYARPLEPTIVAHANVYRAARRSLAERHAAGGVR